MSVYTILCWTGLPFWILSCYPELATRYNYDEQCYHARSGGFKFMLYLYFFLCQLVNFFSDRGVSDGFYSDLIFTIHGLVITTLEVFAEFTDYSDYYKRYSSRSQLAIVLTWISAVVLFSLFASDAIDYSFQIYGSIELYTLLELMVVLMVGCKFLVKVDYHGTFSNDRYYEYNLVLETIGGLLWAIGIAYHSYYTSPWFMVDNFAKTSLAFASTLYGIIKISLLLIENCRGKNASELEFLM